MEFKKLKEKEIVRTISAIENELAKIKSELMEEMGEKYPRSAKDAKWCRIIRYCRYGRPMHVVITSKGIKYFEEARKLIREGILDEFKEEEKEKVEEFIQGYTFSIPSELLLKILRKESREQRKSG